MPDPPDAVDGGGPAASPAAGTTRRAMWGALDQGIYGLTNFGLSIAVAGSVSNDEFGAFSVVLVAYILSLGMVEGFTSEVFTVVYAHRRLQDQQHALGSAAGCALAVGLAGSLLAAIAHGVTSGPVATALLAFAVVVPALYVQDVWRFAFFAMDRPRSAVVNDLAWGAVQLVAVVAVRATGHTTVAWFILAWGTGALTGAALGLAQSRVLPRPRRAPAWLRDHWTLGSRFSGEFVTLYGSAQVVLGVVGFTGGLAQLARIRGAQVLFAPLQGAMNAVRLAVTSIAVQVRSTRPERLVTFCVGLTALLGAAALAWGAAALAVPNGIGHALLGASWASARSLIPAAMALNATLAVSLGAVTGLRAARAAKESFRVRSSTAAMALVAGATGAVLGGAEAAMWGMAGAGAAGAALLWWQLRRVAADLAAAVVVRQPADPAEYSPPD